MQSERREGSRRRTPGYFSGRRQYLLRTEIFAESLLQTFSTASIVSLTCSGVNRCINLAAFEAEDGCSSGADALLTWIYPAHGQLVWSVSASHSFQTSMLGGQCAGNSYHGYIEVVQITPAGQALRPHNVHLSIFERPGIPYLGQDRPGGGAKTAVLASKQSDPARLQKPRGRSHYAR